MDSLQSSFALQPGEKVFGINGFVLATDIENAKTPADLVALFPQWFKFENNTNGTQRLCGPKILDQPFSMSVGTSAVSLRNVEATPFEPVYCIDGHPTDVPIFRPK